MSDEPCDCADRIERREPSADRWIGNEAAPAAVDTPLPDDLQAALGRFFGEEPIETIDEWIGACRRLIGDGSIEIDDLCHAAEPTAHRGTIDGETYHFQCFYDAVILSALTDRPVHVRTESPDGAVIEARAAGAAELTVDPPRAVFSFGIDADVEPPMDGGRTPEEVYAAVCPYVRAFPNAAAYERWAETVPALTVAMPLAGATEIATAIAD